MIRTAFVDDEIKGRLFLRQLCEKFEPRVKPVGEAANAREALELIALEKPDLVFLDIEMPGMTGMEMLKQLPEISFEVVFVTAFQQYAVEAFRLGAIDYLLKPVGPQELKEALDRVEKKLATPGNRLALQQLGQQFGQSFTKITIPSLHGFEFVEFEEIQYLQSESNYTRLALKNGRSILATRILGDFEDLLVPYGFFRVHKSFIVNLSHVQRYIRGEGGVVVMLDGTEIDVSRRRKDEFLERIRI